MKFLSFLLFLLSFSALAQLKLEYISDISISSDTKLHGVLLGGLSGITKLHNDVYVAVSDDRGKHGVPRYYVLQITESDNKFTVVPKNWIELKNENGKSFADGDVDFEGIAKLANENILISSEGDPRKDPKVGPSITEYTLSGKFVKNWPISPKLLPTEKSGVRYNLSLESLATTEDGQYLFTVSEEPLLQDGNELTHKSGPLRIYRYKNGELENEFVYMASAFPRKGKKDKGNNGVVDILPLSANKILVLERAYIENLNQNVIRIFEVDLTEAQDVSKVESLKNLKKKKIKIAKKKLVFDMAPFEGKLTGDMKRLDNIEGLTFGPTLATGERTVVLVSDNNFSKNQRTLFVFLKLIGHQ